MNLPLNSIICGAMPEATKGFPDGSFDAIVTDIPYGIGFMGKEWDTFKREYLNKHRVADRKRKPRTDGRAVASWGNAADAGTYDCSRNAKYQEWCRVWSKEALRIAKPGAFLLCFGGTRTYHRVTCGLEDAGWQIRDCVMWLYGSGFPKSLSISKAIDKAKGVERELKGNRTDGRYKYGFTEKAKRAMGDIAHAEMQGFVGEMGIITTPTTDLAKLWDGYGTALKPAWEPIIVAMKPLDGTFAANAEKWGVAGLNIDGGRIGLQGQKKMSGGCKGTKNKRVGYAVENPVKEDNTQGRWPANLILDEEAAAILDEQSGASRFFYCAKASRAERNAGLDSDPQITDDGRKKKIDNAYLRGKTLRQNHHPTVKPLKLMEYLCTLLKPPSEHPILLDPFCGSGTTLMAAFNTGWDYIGIDKEAEYVEIAEKRVAWCQGQMALFGEAGS